MGMITSGVFHGLILLLFLILVAWREPNPPLPEYGIEINLGFDDAGSGDTRSTEPAEVANVEEILMIEFLLLKKKENQH